MSICRPALTLYQYATASSSDTRTRLTTLLVNYHPIRFSKNLIMLAVKTLERMTPVVTKPSVPSSTLLRATNWQLYESLRAVFDGYRNVRLTYTDGNLEIMAIHPPHERYSVTINNFIVVLSEELGLEMCPLGSSTLRRPDLEKGLEAD